MNQIVANQIKRAYDESPSSWSLEDCLELFEDYFQEYQMRTGHAHPHMKTETIRNIISGLEWVEDCFGRWYSLDPEDYPEIISAYFEQDFPGCNYSMAHFMSGSIRINRCFELGML